MGEELAAAAFTQLMAGEATPAQTAALLMGLRVQGETADEVTGAVRALRGAMVSVPAEHQLHLVDTCGTGGGAVPTFNVSTAAAFVAAGAGVKVAKHGNRSFTSRCGSADLMEALGARITLDAAGAQRLIDRVGIAFLFAPAFHPAMRFVGPIRRELAIPTIMNIVGPLSNPAGVRRQVLGVADAARAPLMAEVLRRLGTAHALVVHGAVGMDEISPRGPTEVWEVRDGETRRWTFDPESIGVPPVDIDRLKGGDPQENAARVRRLLEHSGTDVEGCAAVLLNAAAAIYVAGVAGDLKEGLDRARDSLARGAAAGVLARFVQESAASTSE